jgi:hypothetical protein
MVGMRRFETAGSALSVVCRERSAYANSPSPRHQPAPRIRRRRGSCDLGPARSQASLTSGRERPDGSKQTIKSRSPRRCAAAWRGFCLFVAAEVSVDKRDADPTGNCWTSADRMLAWARVGRAMCAELCVNCEQLCDVTALFSTCGRVDHWCVDSPRNGGASRA